MPPAPPSRSANTKLSFKSPPGAVRLKVSSLSLPSTSKSSTEASHSSPSSPENGTSDGFDIQPIPERSLSKRSRSETREGVYQNLDSSGFLKSLEKPVPAPRSSGKGIRRNRGPSTRATKLLEGELEVLLPGSSKSQLLWVVLQGVSTSFGSGSLEFYAKAGHMRKRYSVKNSLPKAKFKLDDDCISVRIMEAPSRVTKCANMIQIVHTQKGTFTLFADNIDLLNEWVHTISNQLTKPEARPSPTETSVRPRAPDPVDDVEEDPQTTIPYRQIRPAAPLPSDALVSTSASAKMDNETEDEHGDHTDEMESPANQPKATVLSNNSLDEYEEIRTAQVKSKGPYENWVPSYVVEKLEDEDEPVPIHESIYVSRSDGRPRLSIMDEDTNKTIDISQEISEYMLWQPSESMYSSDSSGYATIKIESDSESIYASAKDYERTPSFIEAQQMFSGESVTVVVLNQLIKFLKKCEESEKKSILDNYQRKTKRIEDLISLVFSSLGSERQVVKYKDFFHGSISREECESRLKQAGGCAVEGLYLIREKKKGSTYVLSTTLDGKFYHFLCEQYSSDGNSYFIFNFKDRLMDCKFLFDVMEALDTGSDKNLPQGLLKIGVPYK